MKRTFRVYFNGRKQHFDVFIADNPASFRRRNKCHAYYIGASGRKQRRGLFGYIHLGEVTHELVSHELQHLIFDWVLTRKGMKFTPKNEERIATMTGDIAKSFWRKYQRWVSVDARKPP